jgi:C1A family cysteine protease
MQRIFALALVYAIAVEATDKIKKTKKTKEEKTLEFLEYAAENGKSYKSVEEMEKRQAKWEEAESRIEEMRTKNPKASFKINKFSDMEESELSSFTGLSTLAPADLEEQPPRKLSDEEGFEGRSLASYGNIDWSATGHMTPVKNQG